jgi:putative nucleotidyltransferase with HDIG domain
MYRVRQFVHALTARIPGEEWPPIRELLPPDQLTLFRSMSRRDQRHGLDLMAALREQGYHEQPLLRAALLHDVGKTGHLRLFHRVAVVLLEAYAPSMLSRLADGRPSSWRYPFHAHLHHARLGAERARDAGCDEFTVQLIEHHHRSAPVLPSGAEKTQRLLAALQSVDRRL